MPPAKSEFDPNLAVFIRKDLPIGGGKVLKAGSPFDWKKNGTKEDRVEVLFRTGYCEHRGGQSIRIARKQTERKAMAPKPAAPKATTKTKRLTVNHKKGRPTA
jgi:hypothetical protein